MSINSHPTIKQMSVRHAGRQRGREGAAARGEGRQLVKWTGEASESLDESRRRGQENKGVRCRDRHRTRENRINVKEGERSDKGRGWAERMQEYVVHL